MAAFIILLRRAKNLAASFEGFGKKVRQVVITAHKWDHQRACFDKLAYEVVAPLNVLGATVILRVV